MKWDLDQHVPVPEQLTLNFNTLLRRDCSSTEQQSNAATLQLIAKCSIVALWRRLENGETNSTRFLRTGSKPGWTEEGKKSLYPAVGSKELITYLPEKRWLQQGNNPLTRQRLRPRVKVFLIIIYYVWNDMHNDRQSWQNIDLQM